MKTALSLIVLLVVCGCQTFYSNVVTITQVRQDTMVELAKLSKQGMISPETDAKIAAIDAQFREAAHVLEMALIAYRSGQTKEEPIKQLQDVRVAVHTTIDILAPYVIKSLSNKHYSNLEKAKQL